MAMQEEMAVTSSQNCRGHLGLENRDQAKELLQKPLEALDDMAKEG